MTGLSTFVSLIECLKTVAINPLAKLTYLGLKTYAPSLPDPYNKIKCLPLIFCVITQEIFVHLSSDVNYV